MSVQTGADIPHDVFGGTLTEVASSNMPSGGSPANSNVEFLPGLVRTRGGAQVQQSFSGIGGGPWQARYVKSYGQFPENQNELVLLVNPTLNASGIVAIAPSTVVGSVYGYGATQPWSPYAANPGWGGPLAKSVTQFGREYIAISEGRYGYDLPRQLDSSNNYDRVSQCGPGVSPTVTDGTYPPGIPLTELAPLSYAIFNITESGGLATASVGLPYVEIESLTFQPLQPGDYVEIVGNSVSGYNTTVQILSVDYDTLQITFATSASGTGTGGTAYFNLAYAITGAATAVQQASFSVNANVQISGTSVGAYNTTMAVRIAALPNSINTAYPQSLSMVLVLPNSALNLGLVSSGTIAPPSHITQGLRQCSVSFITRQGYITKPSPPFSWNSSGSKLAVVTGIPTGPSNVVGRLLLFTAYLTPPATTGTFYSVREATFVSGSMQINDNTTTGVTLDFSDSDLSAGFNGQYLFSLVELGCCAGVFSYASRMFWWGELNSMQDFLNLEFGGGWTLGNGTSTNKVPGSGTDGGGSYPWMNPANISSTTVFATIAGTGVPFTSDALLAESFGYAIGSSPTGIAIGLNIQGSIGGTELSYVYIQLLKAGVPVGNAKRIILGGFLPPGKITLGGPLDLWGASWGSADINASGWGFQVTVFVGNGTGTLQINSASATVYTSTSDQPLGWTSDPIYGGNGHRLQNGGVWADAYRITGAGTSGPIGMITQPAYQNYLNNPIVSPNTAYSARITAYTTSAADSLILEFYSPSQGSLALFTMSNWETTYSTQIAPFGITLPASIPVDTVLRLYGNNLASGDTITVDRIELFPTNQPINYTVVRASYASDPESFDGVTGLLQPILSNGDAIRAVYTLRDSMYIAAGRSAYVTKDQAGSEPADWTTDPVSSTVGAVGPNAVGGGEDWEVKANRYGLYIYLGREPEKLSQEIQSLWQKSGASSQINWQYAYKMWVSVDLQNKRVYIGAPINAATECNCMFVMDYNTLDTSTMIAEYPTLRFSPYTGRRVILEQGRKWTQWTFKTPAGAQMPVPCGSFIEMSDGTAEFIFGGAGDNNVYFIDPTNRGNDNGAPVTSSYTIHFFPTQDEEQGVQTQAGPIRSHMHMFDFMRGYVQGSGTLQLWLYENTLVPVGAANPKRIGSITLSNPAKIDYEQTVDDAQAERFSVMWQTVNVGEWWEMQRFTRVMEKDPTGLIRGTNFQ